MVRDFVESNTEGDNPLVRKVPEDVESDSLRRIPSIRKGGITKKSGSGASERAQLIKEMRSW